MMLQRAPILVKSPSVSRAMQLRVSSRRQARVEGQRGEVEVARLVVQQQRRPHLRQAGAGASKRGHTNGIETAWRGRVSPPPPALQQARRRASAMETRMAMRQACYGLLAMAAMLCSCYGLMTTVLWSDGSRADGSHVMV
jgi:hypothetical protein